MSGRSTCKCHAEPSCRILNGIAIIVIFVILPVVFNFKVTGEPGNYFLGFAEEYMVLPTGLDKVFSVANSLISGLTAAGFTSKCISALYIAYALMSLWMSGVFRLQDLLFAGYGFYFTFAAVEIENSNTPAVPRGRELRLEDLEGGFERPIEHPRLKSFLDALKSIAARPWQHPVLYRQTLPIAFLLILDAFFVAHSKLLGMDPLFRENVLFSHFCKLTETDQLMVVYNIALSAVCFMVIPKRPYWFRVTAVLVGFTLSLVYLGLSLKLFDDGTRSADLASSCAFILSFLEDLAAGAAYICDKLYRRYRRADDEDPKSEKSD